VTRRGNAFRPFAVRSRKTIAAILLTFALMSALTITLSLVATGRSQHRATVVEVAARQRMLAVRYVEEVLLVREGRQADPAGTAAILASSSHALLDGGTAPAVPSDDDDTKLSAASGTGVRRQLAQEARLVSDLTATGSAILAHRPLAGVPLTADEHIEVADPIQRLRVLSALASNVSLNAARTIAVTADQNITNLEGIQIALGVGGLLVSLLLSWALIATTRRQGARFRSLVQSSSDLVMILGAGGCRYASPSMGRMVGCADADLLGDGYEQFVHEQDRALVRAAAEHGEPRELKFRVRNRGGEWRHIDALLTDLSGDRHVRGVVLNARDVTERVELERELGLQAQRDSFSSHLGEALEMADDENDAHEVVELAMTQISTQTPMELLLSDSSRANLDRAATSPTAEAPGCPVKSPFSCVAVRRGSPVVFDSSEMLNACPKLRDRAGGACSAVCVPVSFMGRALGVLHATGPDNAPLDPEKVVQLTTLATQAGARIGTLRAFERTQLQASTDGLTGLVNRRVLERELRTRLRSGHPFALAIADLDHFKHLNDTYGHAAGDRALRLFAQIVHSVVRDDDLVARWGGEEFVIVLPELDRYEAVRILERLRGVLAQAHAGEHPSFTASFGVTDSSVAESFEQLIAIADNGLYRSKEGGRDRVTVGHPASDGAKLLVVEDEPTRSNGKPRRQPAFHAAVEDEEPPASGAEIR
jgi:diguanylate cyclase (GGDEF)-like protein/PAS domain S-box-containing protein